MQQKLDELEQSPVTPPGLQSDDLTADLAENEAALRQVFAKCSDVVFRPLHVTPQFQMLLVYVDGLLDFRHLDEVLLQPLMFHGPPQGLTHLDWMKELIQRQAIPVSEVKTAAKLSELVQYILKGDAALLADREDQALIASIKGWEMRSIEEPQTERVIRGPREGFTETIRTNTTLLRRRIRTPRLKTEPLTIGQVTQTDVVLAYIEGIVADGLVEEVRKRLTRIRIDSVLESGYLEEFIEDRPFSPFPQVQDTERPDVVAAHLLEGKVAILTDGTPFALIVPVTFWEGLAASEDYYARFYIAAAIRVLRLTFFFVGLLLPSLYVAAVSYQQEMLPTTFLLSVAASQEATPLPAIAEAFMMEFMFEVLREAGVRLPQTVGSAISIVGALVIGQAAVQAGIVSAPMVIVVATTGIATFTVPHFNLGISVRLLRFPMLLLAGTLGFYGVTLGLLAVMLHLASLRSFGIPYFWPVAPFEPNGLKDVFLRLPRWRMHERPRVTGSQDLQRIPPGQMPSSARGRGGEGGASP
ncbi:MAG: spore germination protein [Alicyclobacillus sp.]|nr:spore germination protein [Alicyclobacillus sp.]